jgi:DNA polymerase-3 subunit gamma/tau
VSYVVFARKYRPQAFEEVVGQEHVARTLRNALAQGRVAHAYLFAGPRGVGKTTMARLLAKAVNCLVSPGPNFCRTCEACTGIAAGQDVDVLEIDAASIRKVEEIQPLVESSRYLPQRSPRKVFIVDEAHMLSKHAFNALLKTLEEPPPHVLFVLATTEPNKIPETVRSRCQRHDFRRISEADIERKLRRIAQIEGAAVEEGVFAELARRATGGLRDAESLLDQALAAAPEGRPLSVDDLVPILGGIPRELRRRILDAAKRGDARAALGAASDLVDAGADPAELLQDLLSDVHEAAVNEALEGGGGHSVEWCLAAAELLARHQRLATASRAARAALDLALLAIGRIGDVVDLEELVRRLERIGGSTAAPARLEPPLGAPPPAPASSPPPRPAQSLPPTLLNLRRRVGLDREEAGPAPDPVPAELEEPRPPPENVPRALAGEELARIRSLPLVRAAVAEFDGRIEHVRRDDDDEAVR